MSALYIDSEAERYALASAFQPEGLVVFDLLTDDLIASPLNQLVLATIRQLRAREIPVDIMTVTQALRDAGKLDEVGGGYYVSDFLNLCGPAVAHYQLEVLRALRTKRQARQLFAEGQTRLETGEEVEAVLAEAQGRLDTIQQAGAERLLARPLSALAEVDPGGSELIRNRYLCRQSGMLLVGPSGIGKSTLTLQLALSWALGRPLFGMRPVDPIKSLLIQAENDEGDLREMRNGALAGLGLTGAPAEVAAERVLVHTCDARSGQEFLRGTLETLVRRHQPGIVWIDPLLAYHGGDINSAKDTAAFLRSGLNPIIHRHNCAAILIHHTNKPRVGKEKGQWQAGDFAYLGSGSADITNWARAVLSIQSIGSHSVFKLHAAKRGAKLRWQDENGDTLFERHIAHASEPGVQYWRDAEPEEIPGEAEAGRPEKGGPAEILKALAGKELSFTELCGELKDHISTSTLSRRLKALHIEGKIIRTVDGKWRAK